MITQQFIEECLKRQVINYLCGTGTPRHLDIKVDESKFQNIDRDFLASFIALVIEQRNIKFNVLVSETLVGVIYTLNNDIFIQCEEDNCFRNTVLIVETHLAAIERSYHKTRAAGMVPIAAIIPFDKKGEVNPKRPEYDVTELQFMRNSLGMPIFCIADKDDLLEYLDHINKKEKVKIEETILDLNKRLEDSIKTNEHFLTLNLHDIWLKAGNNPLIDNEPLTHKLQEKFRKINEEFHELLDTSNNTEVFTNRIMGPFKCLIMTRTKPFIADLDFNLAYPTPHLDFKTCGEVSAAASDGYMLSGVHANNLISNDCEIRSFNHENVELMYEEDMHFKLVVDVTKQQLPFVTKEQVWKLMFCESVSFEEVPITVQSFVKGIIDAINLYIDKLSNDIKEGKGTGPFSIKFMDTESNQKETEANTKVADVDDLCFETRYGDKLHIIDVLHSRVDEINSKINKLWKKSEHNPTEKNNLKTIKLTNELDCILFLINKLSKE